ncbi:hypothetical protein KSP40_PGU019325 [Platanthera guangdongensis]|uniref:Uncharacterized protein n=1 Tax=Platanthera guangdongensis TaxID=2320717 RepID=A0ABR2MRP5_9ASPA
MNVGNGKVEKQKEFVESIDNMLRMVVEVWEECPRWSRFAQGGVDHCRVRDCAACSLSYFPFNYSFAWRFFFCRCLYQIAFLIKRLLHLRYLTIVQQVCPIIIIPLPPKWELWALVEEHRLEREEVERKCSPQSSREQETRLSLGRNLSELKELSIQTLEKDQ